MSGFLNICCEGFAKDPEYLSTFSMLHCAALEVASAKPSTSFVEQHGCWDWIQVITWRLCAPGGNIVLSCLNYCACGRFLLNKRKSEVQMGRYNVDISVS